MCEVFEVCCKEDIFKSIIDSVIRKVSRYFYDTLTKKTVNVKIFQNKTNVEASCFIISPDLLTYDFSFLQNYNTFEHSISEY